MTIKKEDVLNNLEQVKKYIQEAEEEGVAIKNRYTEKIIFQSTKQTIKEAVEEAVENNADLSNANLSGANLSNADLSDTNLYNANLYNTNLSNANLSGANLFYANLISADLRYADFYDTNLSCAKFYGRGGNKELKRKQLPDFLYALGFIVKD